MTLLLIQAVMEASSMRTCAGLRKGGGDRKAGVQSSNDGAPSGRRRLSHRVHGARGRETAKRPLRALPYSILCTNVGSVLCYVMTMWS